MFPAARRSCRQRRGPRGAGARGGHSAWGRRRAGTPARAACAPAPPSSARGAVLARVAGSGAAGVGVLPAQGGRTCGGARVASRPRPHEKSAALGAKLCLGCGARWGPSLPAPAPLPFPSPHAPATRSTRGGREPRAPGGAPNSGGRGRSLSSAREGEV